MPRIALIQQEAVADPAENKRRQMLAIREAAADGAQIVCTQEMCTTLYFCRTQDCELFNTADPIPGEWTDEKRKDQRSDPSLCIRRIPNESE